MKRAAILAAGLNALAIPAQGWAQAYQCAVPASLPRPYPELATSGEPQRVRPITGYTLALTWAPEYCHGKGRNAATRFECGSGNRFGFTLHGLWPDGAGKEWPQYCTTTPLLSQALIQRHVCSTPSAQLMQHEWAKHGTCMQTTPADYFQRSAGLYAKLRYPDMDALSRQPLNAGRFAEALATANPGLPASAIRVTANKRGWLDELWLCLDKSFGYTRCVADSGGLASNASVKIWRGKR